MDILHTRIHELDLIASDSVLEHWLREEKKCDIEGAQGVLLDADSGFIIHDMVTLYCANALELTMKWRGLIVFQVGVMRILHGTPWARSVTTEADSIANVCL